MDYLIDLYARFIVFCTKPVPKIKFVYSKHIFGFAAFVLLLVIALLLLLSWIFRVSSDLSTPPEQGGSVGQYEYLDPSAEEREADIASAHYENQKAVNNYHKDKRNLNAQEGIWRANNDLVLLTFIQILIGFGTLIFLVRTFRNQRSELWQAKRSADASENASRAYIFVEYKPRFTNDSKSEFFVEIRIRNYGKSPASSVQCKIVRTIPSMPDVGRAGLNATDVDETVAAIGAGKAVKYSEKRLSYPISEFTGDNAKRLIFSHYIVYRDSVTNSPEFEVGCIEVNASERSKSTNAGPDTPTVHNSDASITLSTKFIEIGTGPKLLVRLANEETVAKYGIGPDGESENK